MGCLGSEIDICWKISNYYVLGQNFDEFSEMATKIWKKSPTCFDSYSATSKQVGDFFKFCSLLGMP